MENPLKIKFKLQSLEFEIEGNEEVVKKEFSDFKSFIGKDLLPKINMNSSDNGNSSQDSGISNDNQKFLDGEVLGNDSTFPVLKEIVIKDLPKSEPEWILIYCFYASGFGKNIFSEKMVKDLYKESGRFSKSRSKNFSANLKSLINPKEYIKLHNNSEYLITSSGIDYSQKILEGKSITSSTTSKKKSKGKESQSKKGSSNTKPNFEFDKALNLKPENEEHLTKFFERYKTNSSPEKILLIVFYLKEVLKIPTVNSNQVYTCFEELNIKVPKSLYQLISDAKNKENLLDFSNMEDINITINGRNKVKFDLVKEEGKK